MMLTGEAWDISDAWLPFELNLADGTSNGGSYTGPDARNR